jgi:Leucine-rich repeat (LRR) protein
MASREGGGASTAISMARNLMRLAVIVTQCSHVVYGSSSTTANHNKIYKHVLDSVPTGTKRHLKASASFGNRPALIRRAQGTGDEGEGSSLSLLQQAVLTKLYSQTNGPFWTKSTNWLSESVSECEWYGVKCNSSGEITSITLEDNKLYGTTPEELFDISTLLSIDFRQNPVDVKFDNVGNAPELHTLIASDAAVWKLTGIGGAASSLKYLHLTNNDLEGPLPVELFELVHLEELFLNYNQFTGPLPSQVGQLTKLSELYLVENKLSGELPSELGNCETLTELALGENRFTGSIPTEVLTRLQDLRLLALQQEKQPPTEQHGLSGPLPDFASLLNLQHIFLGGNHFTGTIPASFMSGRSSTNSNSLVTIELVDNYLTGTVPGALADRFNQLTLYVRGNKLSGIDEALCSKAKWNNGDVGQYGCDAVACPVDTYNTLGRRSSDNDLVKTCYPCDEAGYEAPYLGSTQCILAQSEILAHFYRRTGGADGLWLSDDNWNNMDQWEANGLSVCDMHGITCEHEEDTEGLATEPSSGEEGKIVAIDLSSNGLTGRIPHEIFSLPHLRRLNVRNNADLNVRFKNIEQATELTSLTVSNTTVVDMTDLRNATGLLELRLSNVGLEDAFPKEVFALTQLTTLYLSYNKFGTSLPTNLQKLTNLKYFYCYDCGLTGSLHGSVLGQLTKLQELALGKNSLTGTVPKKVWQLPKLSFLSLDQNPTMNFNFDNIGLATALKELRASNMGLTSIAGIGQAPALETIHLTDNALSGPIPAELFQVFTLKQLFLNYNAFSGPLSSNIQNLQRLQELFIYDNELSGQIPREIGLLTNLTTLALAENKMTGTLPTELNQLTKLRILALQREDDDEDGITGPLLALDKCPELKEIYLGGNTLVGAIPANFLAGSVYKQTDDIYVDLLDNSLTGIVPAQLAEFDSMKLLLKGNQITGVADEVCAKQDWMDGEVETFGCSAILCPQDFYSEVGRQATVATPCVVCGDETFAPYFGSTSCSDQNGDVVMSERQILENFYKELDGPNWRRADNWMGQDNASASVCQWYGVACAKMNGAPRVIALSLDKNLLSGTVPPSIFQLRHLTSLTLNNNDIDIAFDSIDRAALLEELKLSNTQVRSMEGIGNAGNLTSLHLQDNHMAGPIPDELFKLIHLEHLYMSNNDLTGNVPEEIGNLLDLTVLHLYGNQLQGQIPGSIGNLAKLQVLDLAENDFTGTLPQALNQLTKLTVLNLHQWTRDHDGIGGPLLDFAQLTDLQELRLDSNSFTGEVPSTLLSGSNQTLSKIEISLASNKLTGVLPASLSRFDKLVIDVTDNQLSGIAPELCEMSRWNSKEVGKFGCNAIMCSNGQYNSNAGRKTSNSNTCSDCPDPNESPYFGSLNCGAATLSGPLTQRAILEKFYYYTGGRYWKESTNWLVDAVDICDWSGVTCNDDNNVMSLVLDENQLSGRIHTSLFALPALSLLSLKDNPLKFKFDGIEAAVQLRELKLSGSGLSSVDGISKAVNLVSLHLTDNEFKGTFPEELYQLQSLQSLFLDYNKLSGPIPKALTQQMTNLQELFLFNNRFTGQIPSELGQMTNLRSLALSENDLTGTLPRSLEGLTNLEVLALQQRSGSSKPDSGIGGPLLDFSPLSKLKILYLGPNKLTGTISPGFLSGIVDTSARMEIDLSGNRLEGRVPMELQRFEFLELRLQDNQLASIEVDLCQKTQWNSGTVGTYGCEAIMCEHDTFSKVGRATDSETCQACPEGTSTNGALGSTKCISKLQQQTLGERAFLNMFFSELSGPQWRMSYRWTDPDTSLCEWHGIKCPSDGTETVEAIYLPKNGLEGTVPAGIYDLPNLKAINLGGNEITISFTGLGRATVLEELNLDSTGLLSVIGIGQAPALLSLHLRSNQLQGRFPTELTTLTTLTELDVSDNALVGELPEDLRDLSANLESFSCFKNQLSGELPTWLGDFYNLVYLRMGQNDLSGSIPTDVETNLIFLEHLDLSNQTHFGGTGITGNMPSFASTKYLTELDLSYNGLSGTVPADLLQNTDQSSSISIDLRSNSLQGGIPSALNRFQSLSIYLANNVISSLDESVCQTQTMWMRGNVQEFGCDALICGPQTFNMDGYQSSLATECQPCPANTIAPFYGSTVCHMTPRGVLSSFYQATGGDKWKSKENWMTNTNICTWEGITCNQENSSSDGTMQVKSLELPSNNLVGEIPREVFDLSHLQKLDVSDNAVSITFDGIHRASKLSSLRMDATRTSSLQGIGEARGLVELYSQQNDFGGQELPDEMYSLYRLQSLFLSASKLGGTLSKRIGELTNLKRLYVADNQIRGEIPRQVGLLVQLEELVLSENDWTGSLPETFNKLTELKTLQVSSFTRSSGGLTGTLPHLSDLSKLTQLSLGGNSLSGTISKKFLSSHANATEEVELILTGNNLEGTLPGSLAKFDNLILDVTDNNIEAMNSNLCKKEKWMRGRVGLYGCDALLCPLGTRNAHGRQSNNDMPCLPCSGMKTAEFLGSVECTTDSDKDRQRQILQKFYASCGGPKWHKRENWTSPDVDICHWEGLSCSRGKSVDSMLLGANNIVGTPPKELFELPALEWLWLYSNPLQFNFDGIGNAAKLRSLILDSTGLTSTNGIGQAKSLVELDMRFNNLEGPLPRELQQLGTLESLSLSDNDMTGLLPRWLEKFENLRKLRLGSNKFSGPVLSFSGSSQLISLDLSDNKLSGPLPSNLLERAAENQNIFVDLSDNQITGTVPASMNRFETMTLYLRNNHLEGIDPQVCTNSGWNDGDLGDFGCDGLLCPQGTYSPLGRQSKSNGAECQACEENEFVGRTECSSGFATKFVFSFVVLAASACMALSLAFL